MRNRVSTLKIIAEEAGVSVAAASTALSGKKGTIGVGPRTRQRILRIAEKKGYIPNPLATSLRTGRTGAIGIFLKEPEAYLAHPHGARNFWLMSRIAAERGYRVSILYADLGRVDSRTMDGTLVLDEVITPAFARELRTLAASIPVVSLFAPVTGTIPVEVDNSWQERRRIAAEYLYGLGHRRIVVPVVSQKSGIHVGAQFREVADELRLNVQLTEIPVPDYLKRQYPGIEQILAMDPLPTAVFAIDDDHARNLISRLAQKGIKVPQQISVFSGATFPDAGPMWPGLTGLLLRFDQELEELIGTFIRIIEGKRRPTLINLRAFEVELVERESCSRLLKTDPLSRSVPRVASANGRRPPR